jgi:hypothetical protein
LEGAALTERWSDDRVEYVIDRWQEGASAKMIAEELNRLYLLGGEERFSRNAVIGRVHRMRLPKRPGTTTHARQEAALRAKPRKPRQRPAAAPAPTLPPRPATQPTVKRGRRWRGPVHLLDLPASGACKFPVAIDPRKIGRHLFCARHVSNGGIYCPEHHARMYQQGSAKRL